MNDINGVNSVINSALKSGKISENDAQIMKAYMREYLNTK